jgi:hypothetical protein
MRLMRLIAISLLLAFAAAAAAQKPLAVTRLELPEYEYAEWLADGSGFYVIGHETLQRFDADGRPRGRATPLPGVPKGAIAAATGPMLHRGLSPDGKRLALLVAVEGAQPQPYVIDLVGRRAWELDVRGFVGALEWLADGTLIGWRMPGARFSVDATGAVTPLCPQHGGVAVRSHPDGERLLFGGDELYTVDRSCHRLDSFAPWPDGSAGERWVIDAAVSPSGRRIALVGGGTNGQARLWLTAGDRAKSVHTTFEAFWPIVWLGEDDVVAAVENGTTGTSQRVLVRIDPTTAKARPLVATQPTCSDSEPSVSRRGDRLLFRRLCDDPKGSFVGLVRLR